MKYLAALVVWLALAAPVAAEEGWLRMEQVPPMRPSVQQGEAPAVLPYEVIEDATWYDAAEGKRMAGGGEFDEDGYTCAVDCRYFDEMEGRVLRVIVWDPSLSFTERRRVDLTVADCGNLDAHGVGVDVPRGTFERYLGDPERGRIKVTILVVR